MGDQSLFMSLSVIGLDSPGLVARITNKIFELGGNILDVEENCRRRLFSLSLIIDFSASKHPLEAVRKVLHDLEHETGLKIFLAPYEETAYWRLEDKEIHIVTILGSDQPGIIARISRFFHQWNVNIEMCRMIARGAFFSMEMVVDTGKIALAHSLDHQESIEKMKDALRELCANIKQSIVIQSEQLHNRMKKLIVFDVESTLIQKHTLNSFLQHIKEKVQSLDIKVDLKNHSEDNIDGLIDNVRILKGMPLSDLERCGDFLQLNTGTLELIEILKSMGFKIALLSSGLSFFIKRIFEGAGIDYAFSNTLKVDEAGIITGELEEPIITSTSKNEILDFIMKVENISPDQVIAVGDGSTRSHFIKNVGFSIAFNPDKAHVQTDGILSSDKIITMLYCIGIPKSELEKYFPSDHLSLASE